MNLNKITQHYTEIFPTDHSYNPMQRQTPGVLLSLVHTAGFPGAKLLHFNQKLSEEIGLGPIENGQDEDFLNANTKISNLKTYATAYAGHQFGNWAGQLGDGRAIYAGEIDSAEHKTTELQWKGAGATPYSRHADGRAVLRSTVREYLMSEAMHHLGVPTTRALSLSLSGEDVVRDIMYSGNPKPEKGAVMVRTAPSFLRFGHFELASAQNNTDLLGQLADFCIKNYFADIDPTSPKRYLDWFAEISRRTADLVVEWYRVGFVHGVMNTDNMSAIGLSIDYGPFSMLEAYELAFTPNTTDLPGRRYAFGEQGKIAQWNVWQLANALFPLIEDAAALQEILDGFGDYFWQKHDAMMCRKFGFDHPEDDDAAFFVEWQKMMQQLELDYTLFFSALTDDFAFGADQLRNISYKNLAAADIDAFAKFRTDYKRRADRNDTDAAGRKQMMAAANPRFVLRNYLLYECIEEMNLGRMDSFEKLWNALRKPYEKPQPDLCQKRRPEYDAVAGCSMLSCSS